METGIWRSPRQFQANGRRRASHQENEGTGNTSTIGNRVRRFERYDTVDLERRGVGSSAAIKRHWSRVAALGCIITGKPAEICHCHGGSIVERMQEPHCKGKKLARYDWLVLPLTPELHRAEYGGLDADVHAFEHKYGSQASHLDRIAKLLGVDVWKLAQIGRK